MTTIAALALPVMIGIISLAAEYGNGLLVKAENQRTADLAAYAGALAYGSSSSTTAMTTAAQAVANLNGVASSAVSASLVTSPSGDGAQAVQVSIATQTPLLLAKAVGLTATQLSISSTAYAELKAGAAPCILALSSSGTGVTLSGGASVTASACAVASNNTVSVPCGTTLTTITVDYGSSSAPSQPCSGIKPPSGTSAVTLAHLTTADPLASNTGVTTATARLSTVSGLSAPASPTVTSGGDIAFGWSPTSTQAQAIADGCAAAFASASSTWTLTCSGASSYTFGSITVGGGISVNFATAGAASTTYNFSGSINNTGSSMTFGPGVYNIAKGVITGGGTTTTFAAGTYAIGQATSACNGGGRYSICNTGSSLTFGGPSTFVLAAGLYNAGGSKLTLGSGSTNSFQVGASSDGNAVYAGGGSNTVFADATGTSSVFQLIGNLNVSSGGGSCMTLSAASQHDIYGYFSTAGGTALGAGVYTVTGYVALGANGGGDVTCNGTSVGMAGTGVTFVIGGASTPSSGSCSGQAFCLAAGYSNVTLTAPTTGTTANLVVIGPTSTANTAGAAFAEGASNTSLSGAFYFPNGPVTLSGGSSVGSGSGQCLELIGSQVTLTGGTTAASTCVGAGSTGATVKLVQ
ncbi:MAG: hypothetical protein P4L73_18990 [Caulobacteraceae bacterium]|nr:hypothetical protein [Caulobacteraceae bacterium]